MADPITIVILISEINRAIDSLTGVIWEEIGSLEYYIDDTYRLIRSDITNAKNAVLGVVGDVKNTVDLVEIQVHDIYRYLVNTINTNIESVQRTTNEIKIDTENIISELEYIPQRTADLISNSISTNFDDLADAMSYVGDMVKYGIDGLQSTIDTEMSDMKTEIVRSINSLADDVEDGIEQLSSIIRRSIQDFSDDINFQIAEQTKMLKTGIENITVAVNEETNELIQFQTWVYQDFKKYISSLVKFDPVQIVEMVTAISSIFSMSGKNTMAGVDMPTPGSGR